MAAEQSVRPVTHRFVALETLRAGFFWRTFLLLTGLVIASVVSIFATYRLLDPAPPEQRLAWEITSIVNLTRSALLGSAPGRLLPLLEQLSEEEGLRVIPLEPGDRVRSERLADRLAALQQRLQGLLDEETRVAGEVNDEEGLWVSFRLAGDAYWLVLPFERLERQIAPGLTAIVLITGLLSLIGAFLVSWQADRPLAAIALALNRLGRGERVAPLPETGPPRLAAVRRNFNRMRADLAALEDDRSLALAGISHDLRSPLTRLRLEIEMAALASEQRQSLVEEIERIDAIVGQFVDYARLSQAPQARRVDAVAELSPMIERYQSSLTGEGQAALSVSLPPQLGWYGDPMDLRRVLSNLIDNALRHGRDAEGRASVSLALERRPAGLTLVVEDHGPGIPPDQIDAALRPFSRLDPARSDAGQQGPGTGLGLAIVARIVRRLDGELRLETAPGGGLRVTVVMPDCS
jgi:two-component system osmolarity sensor histidine kinase EnvZ